MIINRYGKQFLDIGFLNNRLAIKDKSPSTVPPACILQPMMAQTSGPAPASSPPAGDQSGPLPVEMPYQQRFAHKLRVGLRCVKEKNMVEISSNGLVSLETFLDALCAIEGRVTLPVEVWEATPAGTHLKVTIIYNSGYIMDDEAASVQSVDAEWFQTTDPGDHRPLSAASPATQHRPADHELRLDPLIPVPTQPTIAPTPIGAAIIADEHDGVPDLVSSGDEASCSGSESPTLPTDSRGATRKTPCAPPNTLQVRAHRAHPKTDSPLQALWQKSAHTVYTPRPITPSKYKQI